MAIVLTTLIVLNPNNQLAHIQDTTNLVVGTQYVVNAQYMQGDTRINYQGFMDVTLTKIPIGVPAPLTTVTCEIETVPVPAAVPPVARYPYGPKDRLTATYLNFDLDSSVAPTPPNNANGTARQGKLWMDISVAPPALRLCTAFVASPSYVAGEWFTLGHATGGGSVDLSQGGSINGSLFINNGNLSVTNGVITVGGPNAAIQWAARDNANLEWLWYAVGGYARLWDSVNGDRVLVDTSGNMTLAGNFLCLANGSAAVNTYGGPLLYSDVTNMVLKLGSGNGNFLFQNWPGADIAQITAGGAFVSNSRTLIYSDGSWNYFYNHNGTIGAYFGDNQDIFRNETFTFQNQAGSVSFFAMADNGYNVSYNIMQCAHGGDRSLWVTNGTGRFEGDIDVQGNVFAQSSIYISPSNAQIYYPNNGYITMTNTGLEVAGALVVDSGNTAIYAPNGNVLSNGQFNSNVVNGYGIYANQGSVFAAQDVVCNRSLISTRGDGGFGTYGIYAYGNIGVNGGWLVCQGNIDVGNDVAAHGVFRQHSLSQGGAKGARIECFGGIWDSVEFLVDGGENFYVSPDGANGFYIAPTGGFSDARLKTNIRDTEVDALATICSIPVRQFEWNAEGFKWMPRRRASSEPCGIVAQELEAAIPEAVGFAGIGGDPMRRIIDNELTPYLWRAIQQLKDELEELKRSLQ